MNFKTKLTTAACAAFLSTFAHADWTAGIEYSGISDEIEGTDLSFGIVSASVGYRYELANPALSLTPMLRVGTGVKGETYEVSGYWFYRKVDIEIDRFVALSLRGQYDFNENFAIFVQPTYANLKVTASGEGFSDSESEWETGIGAGFALTIEKNVNIEASYETFDGTNVVSIGARYHW